MERELRGGVGNVDDVRDAFIRELQGGKHPGGVNAASSKRNWEPSAGDLVLLKEMSRAEFNGAKCR
jgi:hypothetical protein